MELKKSRMELMEQKIRELEQQPPKKVKKFKFPSWNVKKSFTTAKKKDDFIVVEYLTQKYGIKFKLCKIISGNVIVVNNKAHRLDPKKIWTYGKYKFYIYKEIDREAVSNENLDEIKERKDDTEADVPLIKAVLGAVKSQQAIAPKNIAVIIGILAAIGLVVYLFVGR